MGLGKPTASRRENTGNPILDRIQDRVRELVMNMKFVLSSLGLIGLGSVDIEMRDADYTLSIKQAQNIHWSFTGTLTQVRRVIVPAAVSRDRSYVRWTSNLTTGGFALTFITDRGGASANVASVNTAGLLIKDDELETLT